MKVCFIGLGSIGVRHLKNLIRLAQDRKMELAIDAMRSGKGRKLDEETAEEVNHVYYKTDDMPNDYDIIFLTNPTSLHYQTLLEVKDKSRSFFVEKPVFHTSKVDLLPLSFRKDQILYVACPMRYENTIQYMKKNVDMGDVICARAISSSYLPNWRPGTDYRKVYSAHKELGGGVAIDLIHEWDYLCYLLQPPRQVHSFIKKKSDLEIDSDDIAVYIGQNENCIFELHLDYFGREEIRKLQLFMGKITLTADFLKGTICDSNGVKMDFHEQRDDYQIRELAYFLDIVEGKAENTNNMEMALRTLRLAEGVV